MSVQQLAPTTVEEVAVVFRMADPGHDLAGVRLWCDLDLGPDLAFAEVPGGWELRLPTPEVDCLEYLFEIATDGTTDGDPHLRPDPGNPDTVDGAFGAHSCLALPTYAPPAWLDDAPVPSRRLPVAVPRTPVGRVDVEVWAPADAADDEPLPVLFAHDGPEMDLYGLLTRYVGALVAVGGLPRMRVALLSPGARNTRYAANPAYAAALAGHVVPRVLDRFPSGHPPVLAGQSLGGVAALHAAWTSPATFGGLLLQSGSFFTPELDGQESGFEHWSEVTSFVASVHAATTAAPGAPRVAVTCGTAEENLANNRLMADHLAATGMEVAWGEVRQGHTWTCWRDLLDPHLTDLLRKVWD